MHQLIDVLERHGLVDAEEVEERLKTVSYATVCKISEDIHDALEQAKCLWRDEAKQLSLESPNLLASSSIRGDRCAECGHDKLQTLARYAALYADRVIVPYQFEIVPHDSPFDRAKLSRRILSLVALRPVVEADVLRPVLPEFHYCEECGKGAKGVLRNIETAVRNQAERSRDDFEFVYRPVWCWQPCSPRDTWS